LSLLRFNEFHCWRSDEPLFEPVNFDLEAGDIAQVVGPNGAGKTTLLRCLCGLYEDFLGEILWRDVSWKKQLYEFSRQMLYLGHNPGIKKALTARENLRWYFGLQQGCLDEALIQMALDQVGLEHQGDTLCQEMSAGQLRRVGLARLFICKKPLWILDEPFTAIDVTGVAQLEQLLVAHADRGGSVLLTTHQSLTIPRVKNLTLIPGNQEVIHEY
jgi:heme exporter protein A